MRIIVEVLMKRITLSLCAMLVAAIFLALPIKAAGFQFAFGPKVDLGLGFFTGEDWKDLLDAGNLDNRVAFTFSGGLMFDITFFRARNFGLGIQPELLFTITGGGWTYDDDNYRTETYYGIDIPIYIKPKFKLGNGDFYFLIGPAIFIPVMDYEWEVETPMGSVSSDAEVDADVVVGIGAGLGYDIYLGPGILEIGCSFTHYIMEYWDNYKQYQNKFVFSVGYAFNLVR
jgi:hypothetical protein